MRIKKRSGVAIITVLLILAILFTLCSAFFYFTKMGASFTVMSYESTVAQYCANSGIEYALFLMRHNLTLPRDPNERLELLISDDSFPAGEKIVNGVGVFRFKIIRVDTNPSGRIYNMVIESRGQVFPSWENARDNVDIVAQRTAYADIRVGDSVQTNYHKGTLLTERWYEKWR